MNTPYGHLSYCTNIHPGEDWPTHFAQLQQHVPAIKKRLSPDAPFGIGLRLANKASLDLMEAAQLEGFKNWLKAESCYVFTMNGFPYGGFHHTVVKADVHTPDWLTEERVQYTIRLAQILAQLLPDGEEGSISTNPLSYRYWHQEGAYPDVFEKGTHNLLRVVETLVKIKADTGTVIHIDLEPEPDGMLETGPEFINWFKQYLLPLGTAYFSERMGMDNQAADTALREHVRLCFDICHFAIGFEDYEAILKEMDRDGIRTGKIQVSAALRRELPADVAERSSVLDAFARFNEPVYLHQVIAKNADGALTRYRDLPQALAASQENVVEWRAHYHVPLFAAEYGILHSTQNDIERVIALHKQQPFATHLEVETYTWDVLAEELKLPITDSIARELEWVKAELQR